MLFRSPIPRVADPDDSSPGVLSGSLAYLLSLGNRLISSLRANAEFLSHGVYLWLCERQLRPQFWVFLAASFFFDLGVSAYFFLFNLFLMGRGYSEAQLGVLTSALALGTLAGAFPAGHLIQRVGLQKGLLICLVLVPGILCARALLPTYALQIPIAVITGIALSLWAVCVSPAVAATTSERERPFAFSILFSIGIGVGALGALLGSRLPALFAEASARHHLPAPDQLALIASCLFAVLGVIPASAVRILSRTHNSINRPPMLSRSLLRFLLAVALWGIVTGSFSPFANVFFAAHFRMRLPQIGTVFSISQVAQVCAVLAAPLVLRRWGTAAGVALTQFATSLCFLILAASSHAAIAASVYVALTALQWMNEPGIYSMLMSIVPEKQRAGASASMSFTLSCSQLLAAASAGWAFKNFGYPPTLRAIAVVAIIAAAMFMLLPSQNMAATQPYAPEGSAG